MTGTFPTCKATGHKIYTTQAKADYALQSLKSFGKGNVSDLHVWECPECGKYHVGHFSSYIRYLEDMERHGKLDLAY